MATKNVAEELVKQMLADGRTSFRAKITDDKSKRDYFVLVREKIASDDYETSSVLYPAATSACKCCGK